MLNKTAMEYRINHARELGVPIVNYGILIAHVQGIIERAVKPFPMARMIWEEESV